MSAMSAAARGLVATRHERYESIRPLEESQRRLGIMLEGQGVGRKVLYRPSWVTEGTQAILEVELAPPPATLKLLKGLSLGMALLVAASAWVILAPQITGSVTFLLPLMTVLAILGFPMLVLAMASNREAEESRIRKAIRVALLGEEEKFPPQQRWKDED